MVVLLCGLSAATTGWLVGRVTEAVAGNRNAPWIIGRAAGISAYLLMVLLVAHRARAGAPRPVPAAAAEPGDPHPAARQPGDLHPCADRAARRRARDRRATPASAGAARSSRWASSYRPAPVTLGVIGLYAGLLAGLTAGLAGHRVVSRVWWPVHKVAAGALVLVWAHGVLAGVDTPLLLWLYLLTGAAVLALACWRYVARTPRDLVDELAGSPGTALRHGMRAVPDPDPVRR